MIPDKKPKRLLSLGLTALAVGGVVLTSAAPTTAAPKVTHPGALSAVHFDLVDRLTKWYPSEAVSSPTDVPVGFMTAWFGQIQNADDTTQSYAAVGNLDIVAKDDTTGAVTAYMSETIQFPDGAIRYSGDYNRTDAIAQKWITIPVHGISGRYAGMSGLVHWRITSVTDPSIPVEEHVTLYGLGS